MLGVDTEALRTISADTTAAATALRKLPAQGLAPGSQPGSAATIAAQAAEKAWLADLHRLADAVASFGTVLTAAAARYATGDDANADDLRSGAPASPASFHGAPISPVLIAKAA